MSLSAPIWQLLVGNCPCRYTPQLIHQMLCVIKKKNRTNMRKPNLILLIFILSLLFLGCKEEIKDAETQEKETAELNIDTVDYEIVKTEDQSQKALGKKSLSQYQKSELEKLPTNKKILYRIVLSKDISENQVKPTVEKIIDKLTSGDSDIDEIILWLYSDKEISNSTFDIGTAVWAPNGELGNIDANIARNNNRENYRINYQIKQNLEQYLSQKIGKSDKFGLNIEERKQVFKDIVKAEDDAYNYKESEQEKVLKDNKSKLLKKYNITVEQLKEIGREGQDKYWPLN